MDYCDFRKATQDAEWLAGSELDNAERNLARAYLEMLDPFPRPDHRVKSPESPEGSSEKQKDLSHRGDMTRKSTR